MIAPPNQRLAPPYHLLLLFLAVIISLYPLLLGRFYGLGDVRDVFLPLENFFRFETLAGRLPAWLPDASWGFPAIASAQIGFFYPPSLILRFLPLPIFLSLSLALHFLSLAAGSYAFLRQIKFSREASLLAAASFTLGGFITGHLTHLNIIYAASWLPWQFLYFHLLSARPRLRPASLIVAVWLIALPVFAGQIQIPLLMAGISLVWFIFLAWFKFPRSTLTFFLLACLALSFLLTAVQLLPTFELARFSNRASGGFDLKQANQYSYPFYHLPTLLFPRFFGNDQTYWGKRLQLEYGFYFGTIPLVLSIVYLTRVKWYQLSLEAKFFLCLLGLSFLLALGDLSPFRWLNIEPSLWIFSAPARWLLFASFAFAFFIAAGYDSLARQPHSLIRPFFRLFIFLLAAVIISNILLHLVPAQALRSLLPAGLSATHQAKLMSLFTSARTTSLSLASPLTWLPPSALLLLFLVVKFTLRPVYLIVFTLIELTLLAATATPTLPWSSLLSAPASIKLLPASVTTGQARLYSLTSGGDTGAFFTNPDSRANAVIREQQRQLLVPLINAQFNLPGVMWPASLPLQNQLAYLDDLKPAESAAVNLDLARQLNIGAILSYDESLVVTPLDPLPRASALEGGHETPATYLSVAPNAVEIHTRTNQPAQVIIRDTWYPGWRAWLNGQPVTIEPYQHLFRSLSVPAGSHQISLRYHPRSLYLGLTVSFSTVIISLLMLLFSLKSFVRRLPPLSL